MATTEARLKITEIFGSIQGESDLAGWPTVFVRLDRLSAALSLVRYAVFVSRRRMVRIPTRCLTKFAGHGFPRVCVTGGEPLAQKRCIPFLVRLCDAGYIVSLETSGALSVAEVDPRVIKVLDLKAPGSAEVERNDWTNLDHLQPHDQIKFVLAEPGSISTRALETGRKTQNLSRWQVLFSPVWGELRTPPARRMDS